MTVQAEAVQLRTIGEVAAQNIANTLKLPAEAAKVVEAAIRDEINMMSSHFTLAIADVQTTYESETARLKKDYETEVAKIKSAFTYVEANVGRVLVYSAVVFALGVVVGLIV